MRLEPKIIMVLLFLGFVWGSAFILMKLGLNAFNPIQLASLRLVFAGSVAVFFFFRYIKVPKGTDWIYLALSGLVGNFFPAYLFASAGSEIPSSLSGALNALTPFFTLVFGVILFRQIFNIRQLSGILIGLSGALILILTRNKDGFQFQSEYILPSLKVVLAALLYGLNVNLIKSRLHHLSPFINGMIPLTIVAMPALFIGFRQNTFETAMISSSLPSLGFIFILGVIGSALSLIVFNRLIQQTTALFAASVTYLIPVFAYIWGFAFGEPLGVFQIAGMFLILGGITLTR